MSRSVRMATLLCFSYSALLAFETLWIEAGRSGLGAAIFWAEIHPARGGVPGSLLGSIGFFAIAWGIYRRRRWAWFAAVIAAGLLSVGGTLAVLIATLLRPRADLLTFALAHPAEAAVVLGSMGCLGACAVILCTKETRDWFLRREPNETLEGTEPRKDVP